MKTVNNYTETDSVTSPRIRGANMTTLKHIEYLDLVSLGGGSYLCLAELDRKSQG